MMNMRRFVEIVAVLCLGLCRPAFADTDAIISAPAARALQTAGKLLIVDVRTPQEWRESGIPSDALAIELPAEGGTMAFVSEILRAVSGDRNAPVAVICRSGNRSTKAQALLRQEGFSNVLNVKEGVLGGGNGPGWAPRGLPIQSWKGK